MTLRILLKHFTGEVLNGQVILPVCGQRFVDFSELFLGDIVGVASPNGLSLAQDLVLGIL